MKGYKPLAMAEFWWGASPSNGECRRHGLYYPACRGKCQPILAHMLRGLPVQTNPLDEVPAPKTSRKLLDILTNDDHLLVVNKPEGVLSVPGRTQEDSIYSRVRQAFPNATGPLLVHRLDLSTSGTVGLNGLHQVAKGQDLRRLKPLMISMDYQQRIL